MGIHTMDGCRWALRKNQLPRRVISVGGRLAYDDDAQTPNTLITMLDYEPAPIIFEVRGLPKNASYLQTNWEKKSNETTDQYRGIRIGAIVICEGGCVQGGAAYDYDEREIKRFTRKRVSTKQNFIDCVRSRQADELFTDAQEDHMSAGLVHMTNISYRLGREAPTDVIRETVQSEKEFADSFDRLMQHLEANQLDLLQHPLTLGPLLTFDTDKKQFLSAFAQRANELATRHYRKPYIVSESV